MQNDTISNDLVLELRALCYENRSKIEKHPRNKLYCFVCKGDVAMEFRVETMYSPGYWNDDHTSYYLNSTNGVHGLCPFCHDETLLAEADLIERGIVEKEHVYRVLKAMRQRYYQETVLEQTLNGYPLVSASILPSELRLGGTNMYKLRLFLQEL